jgi:uncharacterized protein YqeY
MIRQKIQSDMIAAIKARDQKRLDTLRYLLSQIKNREIDLKHELTDDEATKLLQTEAKRRRESIEAYEKGRREDLVEKEQYELSVIEAYLPKQLSDDALRTIIDEVKRTLPAEALAKEGFGSLMRETMKRVAGRADGSRVAVLLKKI